MSMFSRTIGATPTGFTQSRLLPPAVGLAFLVLVSVPSVAAAQLRHGGRITKNCSPDSVVAGATLTCDIRVKNTDTFNDTLMVQEIGDEVKHFPQPGGSRFFDGLMQGPQGLDVREIRGGCFNGANVSGNINFFAENSVTCSSDTDCVAPPLVQAGVCITGACVGGNNDLGFCRLVSSPAQCPGGTCRAGVCDGGTNNGRGCCDCPGGTCELGSCTGGANATFPCCECPNGTCAQGECVGGSNEGNICTRDDCPLGPLGGGGSCLSGTCNAGSGDAGSACTTDQCPGGTCAVLLPREGQIEIRHTDTANVADVDLPSSRLQDLATAGGLDVGTFRRFDLEIPDQVTVLPPPQLLGCRITGGGTIEGTMAEILEGKFAGQVGAPCACLGCIANFDQVQGNWGYMRKRKSGALQAKAYNSLICRFDGLGGPEPPRAPANLACFSGVAEFTETSGKRTEPVAFRVDMKDRGEPGTNDEYRIRIWRVGAFSADVARSVCCEIPEGQVRTDADIDEGGTLIHGNLQIHPALPKSEAGICPPPREGCPQ